MAERPGSENTFHSPKSPWGSASTEASVTAPWSARWSRIEIPLNQEELSIERHPGRPRCLGMLVPRDEDETLIVFGCGGELVVTKQIFLVEELHVCRMRKQQIARQTVRSRQEDVHIEHPPAHESPLKGE
jgi:stress response protein YsnF